MSRPRTLDLAPAVDWSSVLPLGVSPPLFAQCLETWLTLEASPVLCEILQSASSGAPVRVMAHPPDRSGPWSFTYRELTSAGIPETDQAFQIDPRDQWFGPVYDEIMQELEDEKSAPPDPPPTAN